MRYLYLHGFASSPSSGKAQFFRRQFERRGVELHVPAMDGGDFERLTIGGQLEIVERLAGGEPVALIGSSMGAYVSALYASRRPDEVRKLVLLAPAFGFLDRWPLRIDAAEWERTGWLEVHHYGYGEPRRIHFGLVEDARRYPSEPSFNQPALLFHGTEDDVVPASASAEFAARHPNVRLRLFEADHQLTGVVDEIWADAGPFLLGAE